MKRLFLLISCLACIPAFSACGKSTPSTPVATATNTSAPEPTATEQLPGITLAYGDNAQVELVTTAGRHIYIDVWDATSLIQKPSSEDVLLTTHKHMDHYDSAFVESFPGQKIITAVGEIQLPDVKITAIASAHNATDPIQAEGATNYLFLIEMDGLRIAHFGDIGQDALTEEQLTQLGAVDLAITQLSNSYSGMNAANRMGINLMNQVKPRLIIPTHTDQEALGIAVGLWKGFYSESRTVTIRPDTLPSETSILVMGGPGIVLSYATIFNLEVWK